MVHYWQFFSTFGPMWCHLLSKCPSSCLWFASPAQQTDNYHKNLQGSTAGFPCSHNNDCSYNNEFTILYLIVLGAAAYFYMFRCAALYLSGLWITTADFSLRPLITVEPVSGGVPLIFQRLGDNKAPFPLQTGRWRTGSWTVSLPRHQRSITKTKTGVLSGLFRPRHLGNLIDTAASLFSVIHNGCILMILHVAEEDNQTEQLTCTILLRDSR